MEYKIREIKEKDFLNVAVLYKKLRGVEMKYQFQFYTQQRIGKFIKVGDLRASFVMWAKN